MNNIIVILLLAAVDLKPTPGGPQINWEKWVKTYPEAGQHFIQKRMNKNGWKFDNQEWEKLREGKLGIPEFSKDSKHGSNGGYDLA